MQLSLPKKHESVNANVKRGGEGIRFIRVRRGIMSIRAIGVIRIIRIFRIIRLSD